MRLPLGGAASQGVLQMVDSFPGVDRAALARFLVDGDEHALQPRVG